MELRIQLRLPSRHLSAEHHFYESSTHWKVHPTPGAIKAGSAKRARVRGKLTRVLQRLVGPLRARTRRGLVVDYDPSLLGLQEQVDPSVEHLTVVLDELNGILDQHAVRAESGVEDRPEASCTLNCVGRGHRPLTRAILDEGRGAIDRIVAAGIYELRGNYRMERGAYPPHVIAVNRDTRPYLDDIA